MVAEVMQRAWIDDIVGGWRYIKQDLDVLYEGEKFFSSINLSTIKKSESDQRLLQQSREVPMMLKLMGGYLWS